MTNDARGVNTDAVKEATATGRSRALGLVFPPAGDRYTGMQLDFVGRVAEAAQAYDYDVLLTTGREVSDAPFQRILAGHRVDGLILMEIRLADARAVHLTELGFPFVAIGQSGLENTWWVDLDWVALGRACVRQLADLGHRRIAFVNRSEQLFRAGYESAHRGLEGFNQGVAELGLTGHAYLCGDDAASGERCLERILLEDPATTALVTLNEASLGGVYRGLTRAGRVVPRDFSVVGLSAGPWAESVIPPLTAVDEPVGEICQAAVELLMERLDTRCAAPRQVMLRPLISIRSSTGRCRSVPGAEF
ncbi:LacI family DNA-binding transcriptional regulator [Streptomyces sp. NBC_01262]|uniref:LacI family DNA-binding transcriptional regulator n=1 Tax=Streptomyces sp. NBC_01262 TaxID=2903803 RepID=UPI002E351E19|nr:substrate-binding domain-containing protein [Streptomyces sp. NBC_01262]